MIPSYGTLPPTHIRLRLVSLQDKYFLWNIKEWTLVNLPLLPLNLSFNKRLVVSMGMVLVYIGKLKTWSHT